mmetsp:Transcript_13459/g.42343  ORF Transcript_13459/g.42343 Transcript_13459/m.42343 type:complete len:297 (-) Transcript_13459:18-908(-)
MASLPAASSRPVAGLLDSLARMSTLRHISKYSRVLGASKTKVRNWPPWMMRVAQQSSKGCCPSGTSPPTRGNQASSGAQTLSMERKATGCCALGTCNTKWVSSESSRASAKRVRPSSRSTLTLTPRSNERVKARKEAWRQRLCSSAAASASLLLSFSPLLASSSLLVASPGTAAARNMPLRAPSNSRGTASMPRPPWAATAPEGLGQSACCLGDAGPQCRPGLCRLQAAVSLVAASFSTETCSRLSIQAFVSTSGSSLQLQHAGGSSARQAPNNAWRTATMVRTALADRPSTQHTH